MTEFLVVGLANSQGVRNQVQENDSSGEVSAW
jgi:hypothetical protein